MRSIVRLSQIYFCLSIAHDKKTRLILRVNQLFRQKSLSHDNNINSDQRFLRLWETVNISPSLQHRVHPILTPKICQKVGYLFSKLAVLWCLSQSTGEQCLCMYLKETQFYYSHHTKQHMFHRFLYAQCKDRFLNSRVNPIRFTNICWILNLFDSLTNLCAYVK